MALRGVGLPVVVLGIAAIAVAPAALSSCVDDPGASASAVDGGEDGDFGVSHRDGSTDAASDASYSRLTPHQGKVLASVKLRIVYIGDEGIDGAPNVDMFAAWLLTSSWWEILSQYGVSKGTLLPSVRIPTSEFFPPGMVVQGLVPTTALDQRLSAILHPELVDAGGDASAADASDAAGATDASSDDAAAQIPPAEAYLLMLPNGVNVNLGTQGSHTFQTCIDAGGYHGFDGMEPYAVMPPCRLGRSALAISHEVAELVTNPIPGAGWFSEDGADQRAGGGEIADICNFPVSKGVDGWLVSQLWSNAVGACVP